MGNKTQLFLIACSILFVWDEMAICSLNKDVTSENERLVSFPGNRPVGTIIAKGRDASGNYVRKSYDAKGDVLLPTNMKLSFYSRLRRPLPTSVFYSSLVDLDVVELDLFRADINDQDLVYIAELTSVEKLDLSESYDAECTIFRLV
jgi:hypothetical protein